MLFFSDLSLSVDFDFRLHNPPTLASLLSPTRSGAADEVYQPAAGLSLARQVIACTECIWMDSHTPCKVTSCPGLPDFKDLLETVVQNLESAEVLEDPQSVTVKPRARKKRSMQWQNLLDLS